MAPEGRYPLRKNNWSFRSSMIPLAGDGMGPNKGGLVSFGPLQELPQELQRRSRVSICKDPLPKKPKEKRHIFQKLVDNRHPNSLKRYDFHTKNFEESNRVVKEKTNRFDEDTLMESMNLYRLRQENILILEKSKSDEDKYYGDNTWEISLRERWTVEAEIGNLASVPQPYDLLAQRGIERIGNPLKENMSLDFFTKSDSRQDTRKSRWGPFEHYMQRLEKGIRTTVPHRPNFYGFQLVGNKIRPQTGDSQHRQHKQGGIKFGGREGECPTYNQTAATLSTESLFFSAKAGEIVTRVISVKNIGTTVFFYCWKKRPEDPVVQPLKRWQVNEVPREQRFNVLEASGRLLPGETKSFFVNFLSNFAGSFYETWVLWTAPVLGEPLPPVYLKGVASYQDRNGDARTKITRELEHREMIHGVEEVVEELLNTSSDLTCTTLKTKPAYLYSAAAYRMLAKNLGSDPPLYYNPAVEEQFQNLVAAVNPILIREAEARRPKPPTTPPTPPPPPAKGAKGAPPPEPEPVPEPEPEPVVTIEWDGSTTTVLNAIERVTDEESKSQLLSTYRKIGESAMVPPHPSSTVHLATYKLLNEAIHPLHDVIERVVDDLASTARVEEEARQFARRRKAEDEGMDPDLLEEEPPSPPREPQYDENGEEIPPPPPPKLWESERVFNSAREVLMRGLYHIQDEIEKLEDAGISVVDTQISIKKGAGSDQQTLWDIFALEREKLFIILGKDKDLEF